MKRKAYLDKIKNEFMIHPVVAILGPRQCGKTTLALQYKDCILKSPDVHIFDLEDPNDLSALENPKFAFAPLQGVIIIDEIQRRADLFPYLRVLVDKNKSARRFLILGSASRELISQSSESLAGRIGTIELTPFSLAEVKFKDMSKLWQRGGFPLSFLASSNANSFKWRKAFISSFLERDIPNLGIRIPATTLRRFWQMLAHYHGQIINYSELGRSFGVVDTTVRHYIDILAETFMIRQLMPWHVNIKKRQIKHPKIYIRDTGILHALFSISTYRELLSHPKLGASWEGFALEQVLSHLGIEKEEAFFWGVHGQGELDLFFQLKGKRYGVEFKFSDLPKVTASMEMAIQELNLNHLYCVYPGTKTFAMTENISACGLSSLPNL